MLFLLQVKNKKSGIFIWLFIFREKKLRKIYTCVHQGKFSKKPFVKFICHSASYIFFLLLLALASQRAEIIMIDIIG
jgi:hypothetical protein